MDSAPRRYWQLPVFLLGLIAMTAAYRQFPPPSATSGDQAQTAMATVQSALLAKPNGWEGVSKAVRDLEAAIDTSPPVDSTAAYVVGSWHVAAAEYGKPADSKKHWEQAAMRFAQVDTAALETLDASRFTYRMAKVEAVRQMGKPNETLIHLLNPPAGEDTTFRGTYAYAAAMRITPPDTARAKQALDEFLTGSGAAKALPADLARYKFKLGELYLNDQQAGEAVSWLQAAASPTVEAELRGKASVLLGRAFESLKDSPKAIASYLQALSTTGMPDADLAHVRMLAAEGLTRLDRSADAATAYAQAAQQSGPIGAAAACRLALMNANQPSLNGNRTAEVASLQKCFASLNARGELDNPHLTIDELRTVCERVVAAAVADGDMPSAATAMGLYEKIGSPARAREIKAEALQTLAFVTANRPDPMGKAGELHRLAAAEFDTIAQTAVTPVIKVDSLRKAATSYRAAGDRNAARQRLADAAGVTGLAPETLASIRLNLAEVAADPEQAATLLKQVIDFGGPTAFPARVKLGETKLDQANILIPKLATDPTAKADWQRINAEAATLLEQAAGAQLVAPADQPAHERAMFLLGRLRLFEGKHADCTTVLKSLLQRYPQTRDGEKAKLYLGSSLLVEGTAGPGNPATIEESIKLLEPLMVSATDVSVKTQAGLRVARAHLAARRWQEAITAAATTADASKGTVEELIALSLAYNGYAEQRRAEQMTVIEGRMRQVFKDLPASAFNGTADEYRQNYWKTTWIDFFDKPRP